MNPLNVTTLELWPIKSKNIITGKKMSIKKLKENFTDIIFPWDTSYDQQRQLFSCQIQERPLFIVNALCDDEIMRLLNTIKKFSLTIRIVGGRHSPLMQNPDVFLCMKHYNKICFDKYLKVESGCTQGRVNDFLFNNNQKYYFNGVKPRHPSSLGFPGGSAVSVGTAGITTVGGIGTVRRTYGLTIDTVKSFRIVIPPTNDRKSKTVFASENENQDLYWGLLGGGGFNFGVVTEIIYEPIKIWNSIIYTVTWPWSEAEEVLNKWQDSSINRPIEFNEDLSLYTDALHENSETAISLTGVYVVPKGQTYQKSKEIITENLNSLGGNLTIEDQKPYKDVYLDFVKSRSYHNFSIGKGIFSVNKIPANDIINYLNEAKKIVGYSYVGLELMGGKISNKSSNDTAFYPRKSNFFVDIFNFWDDISNNNINELFNDKIFNILHPLIGNNCYLGFPINDIKNHMDVYYGENKYRLLKLKKEIDPLNLLKNPESIPVI